MQFVESKASYQAFEDQLRSKNNDDQESPFLSLTSSPARMIQQLNALDAPEDDFVVMVCSQEMIQHFGIRITRAMPVEDSTPRRSQSLDETWKERLLVDGWIPEEAILQELSVDEFCGLVERHVEGGCLDATLCDRFG